MDPMTMQKEEHRIISDLSGFDNLKAMYEAEALMRRKKRKKKKKKRNFEYKAQMVVTADAAEVKEDHYVETIKVLKTASVQILQNNVPQKLVVDSVEEREQVDKIKAMDTANTAIAGDGVNSAEVIDLCSLTSEDNGASTDNRICKDIGQTLPTEVIVGEKNKRKRRRKKIRMNTTEMTVDSANKEKQSGTVPDSAMPEVEQAAPNVHDQAPVQETNNTSDAGMADLDEEATNKASADASFNDNLAPAKIPSLIQSMPQPELRPGIKVLKAVAEKMAKNLPGPSSQRDPAAEREIDEDSGESESDEGSDQGVGGVEFSSSDDDDRDSSSFCNTTSGSSESVSEDSSPGQINSGGDGVADAVDDPVRVQEAYTAFLKKFDSKDPGPLVLQNIYPLSGQVSRFRGYTVAMEMVPVLQELFNRRKGLDAGSIMSATIRGPVLSVIGMVIHGLKTSPIANVTEDLLLAWGAAINDAIVMGFDVGFVYLHLRRVVAAVFGHRMQSAPHGQLDTEIHRVKGKIKSLQQRLQAFEKMKDSCTAVQVECLGEAKSFEGHNADARLYDA